MRFVALLARHKVELLHSRLEAMLDVQSHEDFARRILGKVRIVGNRPAKKGSLHLKAQMVSSYRPPHFQQGQLPPATVIERFAKRLNKSHPRRLEQWAAPLIPGIPTALRHVAKHLEIMASHLMPNVQFHGTHVFLQSSLLPG
jgi:hypothetical protein